MWTHLIFSKIPDFLNVTKGSLKTIPGRPAQDWEMGPVPPEKPVPPAKSEYPVDFKFSVDFVPTQYLHKASGLRRK